MRRQRPNVERMGLLGAEVRPVDFGTRTLKEATSEAIRDWITNVRTTHYLIGSCVGPHPYPDDRPGAAGRDRAGGARAVPRRRRAAAGRGRGLRRRRLERDRPLRRLRRGRRMSGSWASRPRARRASPPDARASSTALGRRCSPTPTARSRMRTRSPPASTTPVSGPSTRSLRDSGRADYVTATDDEALAAFRRLAETEGIIPALEPAHALARVADLDARRRPRRPLRARRQGSRRGARSGVKTLVVYLMAGPETPELAEAAVRGGADVVEIGFPFSDPLADGPVIRRAAERPWPRGCGRPRASSASPRHARESRRRSCR